MPDERTTLNDRRPPALICRERGWTPGTQIVGDEGYGPTIIEITAIGRRAILARRISHNGVPEASCESTWSLDCRDWRAVLKDDQPASNTTDDTVWDAWQRHMERCMAAIVAPCRSTGIEVTIVVRAPGAPAALAQVSTNGDLFVARDAISNILAEQGRVH